MNIGKRSLWLEMLLIIIIPILGMALGVGTMFLFGLNQTDYGNLIVNLFFLASLIALVLLYQISAEDFGLKVIKDPLPWHSLWACGARAVKFSRSSIF